MEKDTAMDELIERPNPSGWNGSYPILDSILGVQCNTYPTRQGGGRLTELRRSASPSLPSLVAGSFVAAPAA